jgi:hypothetical protein
MTSDYQQVPLPFDQYDKYQISQEYHAELFIFKNIKMERVDDIEHDIVTRGYKLYHSDMKSTGQDHFELTLVVAKLSFQSS